MSKSRGLFDEQIRLEKLSKKQDPLERLRSHIDFEYFREPLEKALNRDTDKSKGGRPAYDAILMFKILILQRYYNVSDDAIEYAILDRLSFMRFLGLGINDAVPDAKTIWLFRDTLTRMNLIKELFNYLDKQLDKDGIIVHKGKLVDASIVEVPVQRNSRKENQELKEGNVPEEWSDNKKRQKDTDARWTRKNNQNYFGYKNHIKVDTKTKLITGFKVTSANMADKTVVDELLDNKEDGGQPLYGDCAYRSAELDEVYRAKGMINKTNEKGYRNKKITKTQQADNKKRSKVRARVEHVFGFMANSMNRQFLKFRSFVRNQAGIHLMNLTYNLFRLVQLRVELRK
jgi:Transposase and inactivated derivatives, IS5 family